MKQVNTVLGPVPIDQLGWVLMHEHLIIFYPGWELDGRNSYDREHDIALLSEEVAGLRQFGVKTILDATPVDLGRDVGFMIEVAKRSGVNIIASTGLYMESNWFPTYFRMRTVDELTEWMVYEITEGIGETGVKAGAIKVATGHGRIGQHEEKALRAAARAQKKTGAPILTHTENGTMGKEQLDIFEEEGADLSRIIIGHSCGNSDLRYHLEILKRGAILGLDRIGITLLMPDEIRRGIAMNAIGAGYASQIIMSQDIVGATYGRISTLPAGTGRLPHRTYSYLLTDFIPKLRQAGVGERAIETIMCDVPRKFFGE